MRGPMAASVVKQLLTQTDWKNIEFLVIDLPPGTGDIQITLAQTVNFTGAVIISTPQRLRYYFLSIIALDFSQPLSCTHSYVDVVKGIKMFQRMQVPTLAIVENMKYFDTDDGKRYFPFGKSGVLARLLSFGEHRQWVSGRFVTPIWRQRGI